MTDQHAESAPSRPPGPRARPGVADPDQPAAPGRGADRRRRRAGGDEPRGHSSTPRRLSRTLGQRAGPGGGRLLRRDPDRLGPTQPPPAPRGLRRGGDGRAGLLDPRGRAPAAGRGAPPGRRELRAGHGRASLARLAAGRAHHHPRHRPRDRRRRDAARRPAGEPPPLPAEPLGGGRCLRPAARGLRLHPRGAGPADRPLPAPDQQHAAAAQALARRPAPGRRRRPVRRARPRAARRRGRRPPGPPRPAGGGRGDQRARPGGDRRGRRPGRRRVSARCADAPWPRGWSSSPSGCPTASRPGSRSTWARPGAGSAWSSRPWTTCAGSSTSWIRVPTPTDPVDDAPGRDPGAFVDKSLPAGRGPSTRCPAVPPTRRPRSQPVENRRSHA